MTEAVPNRMNSIAARDRAAHIHPQTNPSRLVAEGPLVIAHGDGVHVTDEAGKTYLDAMAGLWSASLGFANPRLAAAAAKQYGALGFYHTFFMRALEGAALLSEKLVALTGMDGGKVVFATSGSEANETMVKLAWLHHAAAGRPTKRKIIARDRAFHGSTIAAASMCGLPFMHREFGLPLPGFLHTLAPYPYRGMLPGEDAAAYVDRLAGELERLILAEGPDTVAAFIAEPIYAGGGIIPPPEGYFARIGAVLKKYDVLLLDDEIVCGFGRTGAWFGKDTVGMQPDMMALAKGLSSAHFPISAVVVAPAVYEALVRFNGSQGAFGHGFTNSGHPVGTAVALEAIAIYEEMGLVDHVRRMGARLRGHFEEMAATSAIVGEVRGAGLMLGIELVADKATRTPFAPDRQIGATFDRMALANGLVTRCMGDTLGFAPPLIVSEAEVDEIARLARLTLGALEARL